VKLQRIFVKAAIGATLLAGVFALGAAGSASASSSDRTADIVAVEATQACYGRAQDVVYRNYANEKVAKQQGIAAFEACFAPTAKVAIGLFGNAPFERADSVPAWVDFVWQYGQDHHYLSTRHLIGNVEVEFTGRDTAVVYSSGTTPHFIGANGATPGVDWITGNYRGQLRRTHGQWLITDFLINADEIAHGTVDYPNGTSTGNGNIGFPDNIPATR
jgi:hypothetical protein